MKRIKLYPMETKGTPILSNEELDNLSTPRLLALRKVRRSELLAIQAEEWDWRKSPMPEEHKIFLAYFDHIKQILDTREHVERKQK